MREITQSEYTQLFFDRPVPADGGFSLLLSGPEDFALPRRKDRSHKYSYGRALIVAGSVGFSGAPVLAANACERSGAGLTQLVVPDRIYSVAAARCDGAVVTPLPSGAGGTLSEEALGAVLSFLSRAHACVIGPGLGLGNASVKLVAEVLRAASCPVVLDADALTICGNNPEFLSCCRSPLILTPHEGEFTRLGGNLSEGRLAGALAYSAQHENLILILKGYGTLICRNTDIFVNPTGTPAMAKGGSGDVLCGILCALLAQGFDPLFSSRCAAYLHGLAGSLACAELGEYCVTPSDIISFLPKAFRYSAG